MGDGDAGGKGVRGTVKTSAASVSDEWGDDGISDQNGSGRTGGSLGSWWVRPGENSRFCKAPALEFLEQHLFRYDKRQYRKEQEEIQIFQAANPKEEMEEIARRIRLLVRTKATGMGTLP